MAEKTGVSYLDATWNPTHGCSAGCPYCWARGMAKRLTAAGVERYQEGFKPRFNPEVLDQPLHWRKPKRIGVSFMGDLFDPGIRDEEIAAVLGVAAMCQHHTFLILTKRPKRMSRWFRSKDLVGLSNFDRFYMPYDMCRRCASAVINGKPYIFDDGYEYARCWPLQNVWLGVSVTNQADADERIPHLLACPAKVRWISYEPALGEISLSRWTKKRCGCVEQFHGRHCPACNGTGIIDPRNGSIDWIIAGCQSGPNAFNAPIDWFRSIRDQCPITPFYLKQMHVDGKFVHSPKLDGRQWLELPEVTR